MSVNVSGIQLARDDGVEAVREALTGSGLPGEHLKIELTESAIIDNPERTKRVLEALTGLDAQIAMDDFGPRSEERRVGKECVSTCRSRWSPDHSKKKQTASP